MQHGHVKLIRRGNMIKTVIKRDGREESFDMLKLSHWAEWASEKLKVDWCSIVNTALLKCENKCTTVDLQHAMIEACVVDNASTQHQLMGGRLLIGDYYHKLYGGVDSIPSVRQQHTRLVNDGVVENLTCYSNDDWEFFNTIINHSKDLTLKHTQVEQLVGKYSLRDKDGAKETPQFLFMRQALWYASKLDGDKREHVKNIYELLSNEVVCAPTPDHLYVGTTKGCSPSCVVVRGEDNLPSLGAMMQVVWSASANGSGIGGSLETRANGDPVRNGAFKHNGKLEYYRSLMDMARANQQSGRAGAITMHYTCLDPEVETIARMKNPTTVQEKRLGLMDYSFGANTVFADAVKNNKEWMLVSTLYAPELYELLYQPDKELFKKEYEKVRNDTSIPKTITTARKVLFSVLRESVETRQYEHFTDEMNRNTPFKDKIYSSNLCQEIALPTKSFNKGVEDLFNPESEGEIATCNLMGINVATVNLDDTLYEKACYYSLLMIMLKIKHGSYPFPSMKNTSINRMNAGVSIISLAHLMAKQGLKYSSLFGKKLIHRVAETHSYFLHKSALRIGKEYGNAGWIDRTRYPDGWFPVDSRNRYVESISYQPLKRDWESLRKEIIDNKGIAFSVLETSVPSESSSMAQDATNSLYPIRGGVITKKDASRTVQWIAPEWEALGDNYELAWDIDSKHITDMYAIVQGFTGQGISADYWMTHSTKDGRVSVSGKRLISEWLYRQSVGMKSRYYINHKTGGVYAENNEQENGCSSGGCTL